jgi:hypothetical protein
VNAKAATCTSCHGNVASTDSARPATSRTTSSPPRVRSCSARIATRTRALWRRRTRGTRTARPATAPRRTRRRRR